ncbi:MAG: hypothetical protein QHH15_05815, partial [Candidatus Thermoplasmatota archaeon]|nr:hypothetical protein [Candidatus Thermoplasmatota archaeon]
MKGSKMLSMLVVFALVLSALMVTNTVADRKVVTDDVSGYAKWILSNDGFGSLARNLTCGEIITLQITNNSLPKNTNYRVRVWNGTGW